MNRRTPNNPTPSPRRWQSRDEIRKAHLDSLSPSELLREQPYQYWLRYGPAARKADRWRPREEIVKEHLDSLSPSELLDVRPDYYWLQYGPGARNRDHARKYDPNQPRVPAGNSDGGQWTSGGGDIARAVFIDGGEASDETTFGPLDPGFQLVASAVTIDYSDALTGISTIDDTTKKLSETLGRVMGMVDFIPEWTPQQYGTAVHVAFGTMVGFQGLPGIGPNDVEHSFIGLGSTSRYGQPGSVRTDVVLRNEAGDVTAIYDVKTGGATLSAARVRELREKTGVAPSIPIIEMHVLRGAKLKGRLGPRRSIGTVIARLWNPAHRDIRDRAADQ